MDALAEVAIIHFEFLEQVREMDAFFRVNQSPLEEERAALAASIGLRERQVATWFQNKRARTKHKYMQADADQLRQENVAMMRELEQHRSLKDHILNQVKSAVSKMHRLSVRVYDCVCPLNVLCRAPLSCSQECFLDAFSEFLDTCCCTLLIYNRFWWSWTLKSAIVIF